MEAKHAPHAVFPVGTSNPDMISDVLQFHKAAAMPCPTVPEIPALDRQFLRLSLVNEEYREFLEAWGRCETTSRSTAKQPLAAYREEPPVLAELGDAIVDLIYVLIGCALEYGLPLAEIWQAIHASNLSKTANPTYSENGKLLKPPNWSPPDVIGIITRAIYKNPYKASFPPGE